MPLKCRLKSVNDSFESESDNANENISLNVVVVIAMELYKCFDYWRIVNGSYNINVIDLHLYWTLAWMPLGQYDYPNASDPMYYS